MKIDSRQEKLFEGPDFDRDLSEILRNASSAVLEFETKGYTDPKCYRDRIEERLKDFGYEVFRLDELRVDPENPIYHFHIRRKD